MIRHCKRIADSAKFQNSVTAVIIIAGILVGVETYSSAEKNFGDLLHVMDKIVLGFFVAEIVIKMTAEAPRPWRYFRDGWNVFDFVIVAGAFMPFAAGYATVLRLLRLLRVLKLVRALPELQMLVGALLKSIPSMGYVSILLFLLFYVYAVAGVFMWGANDPHHFGDLEIAFVSLFRTVTLEDWTDLMYIQMYGCENYGYDGMKELCTASSASPFVGAAFFISFVLTGTMIVLNLFIGVILSGMDEAQKEAREQSRKERQAALANQKKLSHEIEEVLADLHSLHERLGQLQRRAADGEDDPRASAAAE